VKQNNNITYYDSWFNIIVVFAPLFPKVENHKFLFLPRLFWQNGFWTFINVHFLISQKSLGKKKCKNGFRA
jgi:hypothetical protein